MTRPVRLLDWDSHFFGTTIGRVDAVTLTESVAQAVNEQARDEAIRCVYLLLEASDMASVRIAERFGYYFCDVRMSFERQLATVPEIDLADGMMLREATEDDLPALRPIAQTAYTLSRFYNDPHFSNEQCSALYDEWIIKSVTTDYATAVRVVVENGVVLGYTTYRTSEDGLRGVIGLVGVAQQARGKRIGTLIFADALQAMKRAGVQEVSIATQGSNIGAQRLYQRMGFISHGAQLWYHKWFLDDNQAF